MITASPPRAQYAGAAPRWQQLWRDAVTDARELLDLVGLADRAHELLPPGDAGFPLRVPRGFVARMRRGDARDPLLLQVLPRAEELAAVPGFGIDAVGDLAARVGHGVLHKYDGRALLIATGSCAINCRYCFRRHFPYGEHTAAANQWQQALQQLRADPSLNEAILSGGDPLALSTAKLREFSAQLAALPQIKRLRIHTRLPVVLPERVDAEFLAWLGALPWPTAMVLHANHPNEIDAGVAHACAALRAHGAVLLNQAVLLAGVNDDADTLCALSERLFEVGVTPYYLHQLDRVAGAAHFAVPDARALDLVDAVRRRLSGYLVPRLVREVPGEASKTPL